MSQYLSSTKVLSTPPRPALLKHREMDALKKELAELKIKFEAVLQEQASLRAGLDQVMDYLEDGSEEDLATDLTCISDDD